METRRAIPSQSSPFLPIAAIVDPRFTTVDIAASLPPAFGVCLIVFKENARLDPESTPSIARTTLLRVPLSFAHRHWATVCGLKLVARINEHTGCDLFA